MCFGGCRAVEQLFLFDLNCSSSALDRFGMHNN